ncbi:MAG: DNA repair protein RecO [Candidatus Berkelbacteria bacterium]|nr:DNA repair protein RecO [Candidatus Berkelbacteria bacterium]
MRSYKTKAIIIKQYEVGEADRIIVAFSRDLGLITLSARGVRKILAKLKGHLELFNYSWLLIHKSSHGSIDTIIGAETIHPFKKLRLSLESTSRVYLISEFLNRILPEREEHQEIFKLLFYALKEIENEIKRERRLIISSYFLLRAIKELGYSPHFRECIRCQASLKQGGNYFDLGGAGTVCPECSAISEREFQARLKFISDGALVGLRILSENKGLKLSKIRAKREILEEMANLIENYVEYILEAELKSRKFIKQVD